MPTKDLAGKNLARVNLDRTNLAGADLRDATLRDAYARDADLSGADLTGADLTGADLRGSCLNEATVDAAALDVADLRDVDLTTARINPEDSRQRTEISGHSARSSNSSAEGATRSTVESVVAIKVEGEPCCVEILAGAVDCGAPTQQGLPDLRPMPSDHALVTLDLRSAKDLIARLKRAIGVIEDSGNPKRSD